MGDHSSLDGSTSPVSGSSSDCPAGSGPGKDRRVSASARGQLGQQVPPEQHRRGRHVFPGAGPGLLCRPPRPRRRRGRSVSPRAGRALAPPPGGRVPIIVTGHDRGAGDEGEVGGTVVEAVQLAVAAGALGEDARHSPVADARAGTSGSHPGRRAKRSSGIWPEARRKRRAVPSNISCLVSAWTGRGAKTARSGPSMIPMWLLARITPPASGTRSAWCTATGHRRADQPRARRTQQRAAAGWRGARRRWRAGPPGSRSAVPPPARRSGR